MDQRALVERAQRGDHDAFAELARMHVARLDTAAPDGSRVAFLRGPSVVVADIDGSNQRIMTTFGDAYDKLVTWSPEGTTLIGTHAGTAPLQPSQDPIAVLSAIDCRGRRRLC